MKRNGFTLVELMVALLIFGLLSASGVALLAFSVDSREQSTARVEALSAALRTRSLLTSDLAQAAVRLYRREDGSLSPAFRAGEGELLMAFVRRGWANEDAAPRASLQRVEYRLREGRLERVAFAHVDGGKPGPTAVLLSGVRSITVRYRIDGEWRDRWDAVRPELLPQAIETVVVLENAPELRQLFLVGAGLS
ncbi:type II secretion system minor pseudopilin GspJ [Sphingoaurantiacus capsulatus]|uniref:Type II secretion system protein J n=1 Tax=Sphingoaurantiacus capsulatus TaxID=1771310 RepID=A0ABV7X6V9_9SPHN